MSKKPSISLSYYALFIIIGVVLCIPFNYLFLQRIIIPDECYYHNRETSWLFELFYSQTAADGYHPFPTLFNFLFTVAVGAVLGIVVTPKFIKPH